MDIHVDGAATKWLKDEFGLVPGGAVRIMTRYGDSLVQPGFALTLSVERPTEVASVVERDGIQVFVKEQDAWYFDGHDVYLSYDAKADELSFDVR
ncbi:HesB/YadR/YfhF family protein [Alicyclobacillus fastidiosus]|uniref:HesB/YadR/YfhF family protein n=1 Tax=Alicyclobacillus fastidiosus TaxID=392011 RepID=A0ABV5ABN2_9BACL|nr:HesB/YadR/YfhF family protein [Alicyclobacillus fastidiosus]WEH10363.1 HesB/YadR/YfhF family protein [Alicyclobacillus fastidiosus]